MFQEPEGWSGLVQASQAIGVYPGTLYRWWSHGLLPSAVATKFNGKLYFNEAALKAGVPWTIKGRPTHSASR